MTSAFSFPPPDLQISFAYSLQTLRERCLRDALQKTVCALDIAEIDCELAQYVGRSDLAAMAGHGLRGELLFAVPMILRANPKLLGYYRLLLGYSQKEFFGGGSRGFGCGRFKSMEERGTLGRVDARDLSLLCKAFCGSASYLLTGLEPLHLSRSLLDDLLILTVGPQLRGGANNKRGAAGIASVFAVIRDIVARDAVSMSEKQIEVVNATGRRVFIGFSSDPDIVIVEEMEHGKSRRIVAIEVKGGTDAANIHNRLGEAEKSHQKARGLGFTECWTVVNVASLDLVRAKMESPSTDRFYYMHHLELRSGEQYSDFRNRIVSLIAIR